MTLATSASKVNTEEQDRFAIVEEKVVTTSGDVLLRKYQKGRFLGKGGFARCYEFTSLETRKVYAGKVVLKESLKKSRAKQKLMSEIKIHRSVKHPGVVNFEHFFEDSEYVYILLEMCSNQTFSELVRRRKRLTELEVQSYSLQLVSALKYLQQQKIIHRDLKLGNMFLTDKMEIKIGDFGLATRIEYNGEKKRTICGTPNYIAPEVLDNRIGHSYEVDVWSLGVVLYTMLVGKPPFETSDVKTTYRRIRMNAYSFPENVALSHSAKALISRIIVTDPAKRLTYDEILASDFLNPASNNIPPLMPNSTISCPPSKSFLQQFQNKPAAATERLRETTPVRVVATLDSVSASTDRVRSTLVVIPQLRLAKIPEKETKPIVMEAMRGQASIWVTKYVDYSSKYGLGYELSNQTVGVFFNDASKILLSADEHQFYYSEREEGKKEDVVNSYYLTDFPKRIEKKVTLLQHFRSYLDSERLEETRIEDPPPAGTFPIFVKKWIKTKHSALFRLTNKVIQVIFTDNTEIIISSDTKVLTYVDKLKKRTGHTLNSALETTNEELRKRLKYTKDVLAHMLGAADGPPTLQNRHTER